MRIYIALVLLMLLCGCGLLNPIPVQLSPHTKRSINEIVDEKVAKELPKALNAIIGENVADWGPYGISVLLALLYGKKHIDLRKITRGKKK